MAATSNWVTQQLVRYLAGLTPGPDDRPTRATTLRAGAERAAEAVEAELAAVLWDGRLVVSLGFGSEDHPLSAVKAVVAGRVEHLEVAAPGCHHAAVAPVGDAGHLVVARCGEPFNREELILIRALGRILALSLRSVDAVTAERSLRRESERRAREALRDPLTGLPNRTLFLDRLETAAAKAVRQGRSMAVLFMDLDGFKLVNDTLGHASGDELLRAVAARMATATRAGDTVARLGGDEFAVLVDDLENVDAALAVADRIREAFASPFQIGGRASPVAASIGIAIGPRPGESPDLLLRDADLAMYRAKAEETGGYRLFVPEMRQQLMERMELEHELRATIGQGGLICLYQPIVEMATGRMTGLEALVRWLHPQRGMLAPAEFLPLAEEVGIIGLLDNWVLKEVCRQLSQWRRTYPSAQDVNVGVNLSGDQLSWDGLPAFVEGNLREWKLPPARLVLEIRETAIFTATSKTEVRLGDLKALGSTLALDDFGTGYSSLGRLRDIPVYVTGIDGNRRLRALVTNIVNLAHDLGIDVVAEGIETREEGAVLLAVGCPYAQGFHYSRPVPAEAIDGLFSAADSEPPCIRPDQPAARPAPLSPAGPGAGSGTTTPSRACAVAAAQGG